jgi:hypothetical protein
MLSPRLQSIRFQPGRNLLFLRVALPDLANGVPDTEMTNRCPDKRESK